MDLTLIGKFVEWAGEHPGAFTSAIFAAAFLFTMRRLLSRDARHAKETKVLNEQHRMELRTLQDERNEMSRQSTQALTQMVEALRDLEPLIWAAHRERDSAKRTARGDTRRRAGETGTPGQARAPRGDVEETSVIAPRGPGKT